MMDLTRDNDLARMGKANVALSSVSLDAVTQQVRHNKRKERAAREEMGGATPMEIDTPSGTPGGTPRGTPRGTPGAASTCCCDAVHCSWCSRFVAGFVCHSHT